MIEYARGDAGLFNYAVAIQQGGDPAQVELVRFNRPAAEDHPGVGGVVGDGVEHFARTLGFRVDVVAARVDKLQRRDNVVGGVVDIKQRTVRPRSGLASTKASSTSIRGTIKRSVGISLPS